MYSSKARSLDQELCRCVNDYCIMMQIGAGLLLSGYIMNLSLPSLLSAHSFTLANSCTIPQIPSSFPCPDLSCTYQIKGFAAFKPLSLLSFSLLFFSLFLSVLHSVLYTRVYLFVCMFVAYLYERISLFVRPQFFYLHVPASFFLYRSISLLSSRYIWLTLFASLYLYVPVSHRVSC